MHILQETGLKLGSDDGEITEIMINGSIRTSMRLILSL